MKRSVFAFLTVVCFVAFVGCHTEPPAWCGNLSNTDTDKKDILLPDFLVGVWKADNYNWAIKLESDGSISKVIHYLAGPIKLTEGGRQVAGFSEGTYAIYIMGPCNSEYIPQNRYLSVQVNLDFFRMVLPDGILDGNCIDTFKGVVSKDAQTWNANWRSYSWLDGATPPDPNLIENNPEKVIFRKLSVE